MVRPDPVFGPMRIYYDFEQATRLVPIGYNGPHMKNYSSQYVG